MSKIKIGIIVKGAAELAASAGAAAVVGNLVKATTPDDINRYQKILVAIGGFTIGGVLSDLSAKYVRSQIEEYSEKAKAAFRPNEEAPAAEPETNVED